MVFELYGLPLWMICVIPFISFLCEFMDSGLGMGYGTTLQPILIIMGGVLAVPLNATGQIVPAILVSELATGFVGTICHILFKNMNIGISKDTAKTQVAATVTIPASSGIEETKSIQEATKNVVIDKSSRSSIFSFVKRFTPDTKITFIFGLFGTVGTIIAAAIGVVYKYNEISKYGIKLYIGIMVLLMGVLMIIFRNRKFRYSVSRIIGVGAIAGFNKGISGGGYGPLVVAGQIVSGSEGKNAIGVTTFSETIICVVGVITTIVVNYIMFREGTNTSGFIFGDFRLAAFLVIGSVLSAPLAAFTTKMIDRKKLKYAIGILTIILGIVSLTDSTLRFLGVY